MTTQTTTYDIRLRDSAFIPQAALTDYIDLDLIPRMNEVGAFTLTVRADSPALPYFAKGGGIIVTRDLGDGAGARYLFSGPFWHLQRNGVDNTYILAGPDDNWFLKARLAYPSGGYPFMLAAMKKAPLRYYRLDEASGTVAADTSLQKQNATYSAAGVTYGVAGGVSGDPDTAVTLAAASSGKVTIPTTGMPTGNAPYSRLIGLKFTANPATLQFIGAYGSTAGGAHTVFQFYLNTTGTIAVDVFGTGVVTSAAPLTTGVWHRVGFTWDGTTLTLYVDGVASGTPATPGAQAIPGTGLGCTIGANAAGASSFISASLDEDTHYAAALTAADVAADYAAFSATHAAYDARSGLASTVLLGYVNANLIAPVNIERDLAVLTAAADPSIGSTASANARGDNLLTLLQQIASANGDIGFRIVQTANGALQFQVYQPVDRSASVKFSNDFRNLLDYSYTLDGPVSNSTLVYGGGTLAGRTALVAQDAASIAAWGFIEGPFIDARDTSDTTVMTQRGAADINANSQQTSASFKPIDTATTQFQRDYGLGDIVSLVVDGVTISNKVREVHIAVTPQNQEMVTLGVGNPGQGIIDSLFDNRKKQQALQAVADRLNRIAGAV